MTYIYLIRHCEAMGNHKRLFQGSTDCEISEIGAVQLQYLKERFKNIKLDAVFSSPLLRAQKTALAVSSDKGLDITVRENLREIHGGVVEADLLKRRLILYPVLQTRGTIIRRILRLKAVKQCAMPMSAFMTKY